MNKWQQMRVADGTQAKTTKMVEEGELELAKTVRELELQKQIEELKLELLQAKETKRDMARISRLKDYRDEIEEEKRVKRSNWLWHQNSNSSYYGGR